METPTSNGRKCSLKRAETRKWSPPLLLPDTVLEFRHREEEVVPA